MLKRCIGLLLLSFCAANSTDQKFNESCQLPLLVDYNYGYRKMCYKFFPVNNSMDCWNRTAQRNEYGCMRHLCNLTVLTFGDVAVQSTMLSLNSDWERVHVHETIYVLSDEARKRNPNETYSESILVGMQEDGRWSDGSDTIYFSSQIQIVRNETANKCYYYSAADHRYFIRNCRTRADLAASSQFVWIGCKAEVVGATTPSSTVPTTDGDALVIGAQSNVMPMAPPSSTRTTLRTTTRTTTSATTLFSPPDIVPCNKTNSFVRRKIVHCYIVLDIDATSFTDASGNERDVARRICRLRRVHIFGDTVSRTSLLSFNSRSEERFVSNLVQGYVDRLQSSDARYFASHLLLGMTADGWMDRSDQSLVASRVTIENLDSNTCVYYRLMSKAYTATKCGSKSDFNFPLARAFVVCKAAAKRVIPTVAPAPSDSTRYDFIVTGIFYPIERRDEDTGKLRSYEDIEIPRSHEGIEGPLDVFDPDEDRAANVELSVRTAAASLAAFVFCNRLALRFA